MSNPEGQTANYYTSKPLHDKCCREYPVSNSGYHPLTAKRKGHHP